MGYFFSVVFIVALRLGIWKFFPDLGSMLKDPLSNMIIASLIFGLAFFFCISKMFRREGLVRTSLEAPLALWVASGAISLAWTPDPCASVRELIMFLAYILFFYILLDLFRQDGLRRAFIWVFFGLSVIVAAVGVNDIILLNRVSAEAVESARLTDESLYYILTHKRACSIFGWPNVLAGFLMLVLPLLPVLWINARSRLARILVLAGSGVIAGAFFFTFSVLGWTVFLLTALVVAVMLVRSNDISLPPGTRRWLAVGAALVIILFGLVVMRKDFAASLSPRRDYVHVLGQVIALHPWRGSGFGAYRLASAPFVTTHDGVSAFPHNAYGQVWAETGMPGLAAILWLVMAFGFMAARAWRQNTGAREDRWFMVAVVTGMSAFLVDNINSFTMLKPNIAFFFWVWLALACSYLMPSGQPLPLAAPWRRWSMAVVACAALLGLGVSACSLASLWASRAGTSAFYAGQQTAAEAAFRRARFLDPLDASPAAALGQVYLDAFRRTGQAVWLDRAEAAFRAAAARSPAMYSYQLTLGFMAQARGDQARAQDFFARGRSLSPYEAARDLAAASRRP